MFDDDFEILDDFEGIEDGEQSASPSSIHTRPIRENENGANKIKELIDKNKISPNNPVGNKDFSDMKQQDISNNNQKENKQDLRDLSLHLQIVSIQNF